MTYRGRATKISDFDDTEFTSVELGSRIISTGSFDGTIKIWAIGKGTSPILELQNHNSPVTCLNFDDKEEYLLSGYKDGSVSQWDLNEGKCKFQIPSQTRSITHSVCHFPSYLSNFQPPHVVAIWRDDVIEILDLKGLEKKPIWSYLVSSGSGISSFNRKKKKYLGFSPCGRWLIAYANYWSHLIIFNVITSQVQEVDLNDNITCTEFHPTELILSVGTEQGQVFFYNFSSMMLESTGPIKADFGLLLGIVYSDEGKFLFGIYPDSVRVLQSETEEPPGNYITAEWKTVSHIQILDSTMEGLLLICSAEDDLQIWIADLMKLTTTPNSSPTPTPPPEPNNNEEHPQEEQILEKLQSESQESVTTLSLRLSYIRYVNSFLKKGKLKEALEHLVLVNNVSFINIILNERLLKVKDDEKLSSYYTLNDLKLIFPLLKNLLNSDDKSHVEATLISFREILRHFVSTTSTKSTVGGPFFDGLVGLKRQFTTYQSYGGNIAVVAKELSKQIAAM